MSSAADVQTVSPSLAQKTSFENLRTDCCTGAYINKWFKADKAHIIGIQEKLTRYRMQTVYLEANVNILIKNNHRKALYFPSIMLANKWNNNFKNGFELLFLTLTNIHQNYLWRVLHIFMSRPRSWRRLLTGARTQVSFKILRQL